MAKVTRIGLVIEQALGHLTHADNLRQLLGKDDLVAADWMMIPYQADDIWNKVPKLPFSVELSLRARRAVQNTLRHNSLDCLFFHTHNLTLFALGLMKTLPTVISLDATPMNFKSIAAAYDA